MRWFVIGMLLATAPAWGQKVTGQKWVRTDKSAVLSVKVDDAGEDYVWLAATPGLTTMQGGDSLVRQFAALDLPQGRHVFVFTSFDNHFTEAFTVVVSDSPPDPVDPDNPPPPPPPPPPDELTGLAKECWSWVRLLPDSSRKYADGVAENYRSTASAIGSGAIKGAAAILADAKSRNDNLLPDDVQVVWKETFGRKLEEAMKTLQKAGKLANDQDYKATFLEIAKGVAAGDVK